MVKVKGVKQVKINMAKAFDDIKNKKAGRAVYTALTLLDQEQALIAPIKTAALVNNRTLTMSMVGTKATGTIKFMQSYAKAVHGMVGVNWTRPSTVDHWLSVAAMRSRPEIQRIFATVMKV